MVYPNLTYTTKLGGVKLTCDFDDSFSMEYRMNTIGYRFKDKPLHYHAMYEIFFVFDTPIDIETETDNIHASNCMVIVPPRVQHTTVRSRDYRFLFSFEILEKTHFSDFMRSLGNLNEIKVFNGNKEEIYHYLEELLYIFTTDNEMNNEIAEAMIKTLFFHLFIYNNIDRGSVSKNKSYIIRIEQITHENSILSPELCSLDYVAKELSISKKHAARIIKNHYGKTFTAIVLERRLSYACSLLTKTNLSISKISEMSRFQSENYFFTQFKKAYGCTPLRYRKLVRERLGEASPSPERTEGPAL